MNFNSVVNVIFVVFVMCVYFSCVFNEFIVDRVFYYVFDSNNDRFVYFVVNNMIQLSMNFVVYYVFVFLVKIVFICVILWCIVFRV